MNTKVEQQQEIMWMLSELQIEFEDDDILIKDEFYNILDEENYNYDDWVLEYDDLEAIKFYSNEEFQEHLNSKYPTNYN